MWFIKEKNFSFKICLVGFVLPLPDELSMDRRLVHEHGFLLKTDPRSGTKAGTPSGH